MVGQLSREGREHDVHIAADAAEAVSMVSDPSRSWFRLFLDLEVPGAHGLSLAREIHNLQLADRCCVVTASNRTDLIIEVKALGFLGYVVKASPYAEFEKAVSQVLAGERAFPTGKFDAQPPIRISRRQEQLLDCVRRGLSSKEIARVVCLSEGSVNNCINAALKALRVTSRTHAVAKAMELGLLSIGAREDEPSPIHLHRHSA